MLTSRDSYLTEFATVRDDIPGLINNLARMVAGDPLQKERLARLQSTVQTTLDAMESLREDSRGERAAEIETSGIVELRRGFAGMLAEEDRLLAVRRQDAARARRRTEAGLYAGGLLGLLGGVFAIILFTRSIVRRVHRLEGQARNVAKGIPLTGEVAGGDELSGLERTLRETSRLLTYQGEELSAAHSQLEARVEQRTAELMAANEDLRRADEVRDAVIASSPLAIWTIDAEGLVTLWNPAAERVFGWTSDEAIGKPLPVVPPGHEAESQEWLARFRGGERLAGVERARIRKDGRIIQVSIWSAPLRDAAGSIRGTIAINSDITERRQLEEQFRQAQKMEAIGRLAGGVAHDFNNLLTIISGFTDMIVEDSAEAPRVLEYAREIQYAAGRAAALSGQLLAFSRRQVSQPKILDLNELVTHSMKLLGRVIGEDIEVVARLSPAARPIKADPIHIDQVIVNLVVNARDAMAGGGILTLETANVELDADYAGRHIGVPAGSYTLLAISDTGTGMDEATRSRIFEPFFTTKTDGKGTGLGLSIVYGIVKQAGGEIMVYTEPGHGTTFKIYFPVAAGTAEAAADLHQPGARGTGTVMVCEDELVIRKLVETMLERLGYSVIEAPTPADALRIASDTARPIDLLLTDVIMPQSTGFELTSKLRAIRPALKVLYMSGYTDARLSAGGDIEAGAHFLQKPFTAAALAEKVSEALGHVAGPPAPA
jgi:PAS domain S-box-containing protein